MTNIVDIIRQYDSLMYVCMYVCMYVWEPYGSFFNIKENKKEVEVI